MESNNDNPCGIRRYDLKGYERSFSVTHEGCVRIAHALKVTGPVELMLQHMFTAFRMVLNRHPKMRALMSNKPEIEPMTSYIQPPFTTSEDDDTKVASLITIVRQRATTEEERKEELRTLIQDTCNQTVDRAVQYPYFLIIHVPNLHSTNPVGTVTIVVFSDHVFSDGYSGMIVLNDLLMNIRLLIKLSKSNVDSIEYQDIKTQLEAQSQQLPLRPSLYDQLTGKPTFWKRCGENLVNFAGRIAFPHVIGQFRPILPSRDDLMDIQSMPFPLNQSYCLIDSGSKENLESALEACRKEKVTLHGAMVACVLMAHVKAKYPSLQVPTSNFKISFDVDCNMRSRVKSPFPELTVGFNVSFAGLDYFSSRGVDLSERFWDVARCSKQLTDENVSSTSSLIEMIFGHHNCNITNKKWNVKMKKSVVRDVNVSNLGRYPFPTTHELGGDGGGGGDDDLLGAMHVEGLHLYNSSPHIGYNAVVFIASTDHLDYAMCNRMSDEDGAKVFRYIVQAIEAISSIGEDETMLQACGRILSEI